MTQIISALGVSDLAATFGSNTLPDFSNVLGEWWLGNSQAESIVNQITGVNGALIGAPTWNKGYATFKSGAAGSQKGILTDVKVVDSVTIVALIRQIGAKAYVAAPEGSANYNLFYGAAGISFGNGQLSGATDQSVLPAEALPNFTFVMGVGMLGQPSLIYKVNAGGTTSDLGANAFLPSSRPDLFAVLGANGDVNNASSIDVAAVAIIGEAKGQSYAEQLYPMWKAYAQSRGITVG